MSLRSSTFESRRYDTVKNFRTEAVERAYLFPHEPLYRRPAPHNVDPGLQYSQCSLPKGKFYSVEEALEATRKRLRLGPE